MKILYVSHILPWATQYGMSLRARSILVSLTNISDVDCLFIGGECKNDITVDNLNELYYLNLKDTPRIFLFLNRLLKINAIKKYLERLIWIFSYLPFYPFLLRLSLSYNKVYQSINFDSYDYIFINRLETAWKLNIKLNKNVLLDIDDVQYLEVCSKKKFYKKWHCYNLKKITKDAIKKIRYAFVCSENDKKLIKLDNVSVLPNVFPVRKRLEYKDINYNQKQIIFIGTLQYKPNFEGVLYFVNEILPEIIKKEPSVVFKVLGHVREPERLILSQRNNVEIVGSVSDADLVKHLQESNFEVVPLLNGLGTRIKILEALSFQKPVVSTSIGAYGISIYENDGLYREDSVETFTKRCIDLLNNNVYDSLLGLKCKSAVQSHYSQQVINDTIKQLLAFNHK